MYFLKFIEISIVRIVVHFTNLAVYGIIQNEAGPDQMVAPNLIVVECGALSQKVGRSRSFLFAGTLELHMLTP